jgi:predicted NBD/HSP70 family sugar kinase/antitoxin (DNA-binding transcriptional repressor) of toxin-antitoxin stability system
LSSAAVDVLTIVDDMIASRQRACKAGSSAAAATCGGGEGAMETVTVRELSSDVITRATAQWQTLGVTNRGSLVGVVLPLTRHVLERIARHDAVRIRHEVRQAEAEMASGERLSTLAELEDGAASEEDAARRTFARVSIRGLTGKRLDQAAADGTALIVTSDGQSVALLIPVTSSWIERLVEAGIKRFLDGGDGSATQDRDIQLVEQAIAAAAPLATAAGTIASSAPSSTASASTIESQWPATGIPLTAGSGRDFLRNVAIGIEITSDESTNKRLVGVVTDMLAKVEAGPCERRLDSADERHVLAQILSLIDDDLRPLIGTEQFLVGVGLEIGGHVHHGRVIYSPNAHWAQFPLASRLSSMLRMPVVLENDANALAIYERRFTGIEDTSFAVVVLTEVGVGCGLMLDGQIYHGVRGMAGELGHMPVVAGDPHEDNTCRCVNRGCLESATTPHAIELALHELGFEGTYHDALQQPGLEPVRRAFSDAGASLGRAVVGVINLINPSAIIFYPKYELLGPPRTFHIEDTRAMPSGSDQSAASVGRIYTGAMIEAIRQSAFSTGVYQDCRFFVRTPANQYSARAAAACLIDQLALRALDPASKW